MGRAIWLIVGSVAGYIFGVNMEMPSTPRSSALAIVALLLFIMLFGLGRRNKAEAVATAVATAVAEAHVNFEAQLEASAKAMAMNAVSIHLNNEKLAEHLVNESVTSIRQLERTVNVGEVNEHNDAHLNGHRIPTGYL